MAQNPTGPWVQNKNSGTAAQKLKTETPRQCLTPQRNDA